ncbi:MAG TPA: pyridoxal phosphate-dependent aminotransferase [Candidatus Merdisoma merdipullorum]|uniref:cysteine-S-conjugate beta-lyase n=1 Tax=Candidatus Enterocloster excrementipullorum TaxID=2838559 RepID=A0A9D2MZV5_9FIRM|nr:pyridoxal phosphate-dependent aminotransferase [Candidatus Merdisoma merdipullorum]HJC06205.1 pyridoxal phosphate-dependent aminotransferase [Candidatus Enterocloster excrementipullorum]
MTLIHDFDEVVERRGTDSKKYSPEYFDSDVIPMWIADTDFKSPKPVVEAIKNRAVHGVYGYTPVSREFKQEAVSWMARRFGYQPEVSSAEFVPGVIGGVICAIRALTHPGDKILLHTPAYGPFVDGIVNNGRRLNDSRLLLKDGKYEIDFDDFEKKCRDPRTKLFILCNPHNPTSRVFTEEELRRMGEICLENHVMVLSDEIHCDIVFKPHKHIPFASLDKRFEENSITFISPSKTFNVPGFRTAVMFAAEPVKHEMVHQVLVSNKGTGENIFGTVAFCAAYHSCDYYADQMVEYLEGNLKLVEETMDRINGMELIHPEGTYLFWIDCRGLGLDQETLMDRFVNKAKVGLHDGLHFGPEGRGFVRLNVAVPRSVLEQALKQIEAEFI